MPGRTHIAPRRLFARRPACDDAGADGGAEVRVVSAAGV